MSDNLKPIHNEGYWVLTADGWEICIYKSMNGDDHYMRFSYWEDVYYPHEVIRIIHIPRPKDGE